YQIGRHCRQPIELIVRPAILHADILAFDESGLVQALPERIDKMRGTGCRRAPKKSDHWHCRLFRPHHRNWPGSHRGAECTDELAPFHSITSSARASSV